MAYSTGSFTGAGALVDALNTFMTSNGWTLYDTIVASNDLVFKSSGTSGKTPMYMRLTINTSVNNPAKDPAVNYKVQPGVMVRGYTYWNSATHIGTNDYGFMSNSLMLFGTGGTYSGEFFHTKIDGPSGPTISNFNVTYQAQQYTQNTTASALRNFTEYLGNRWMNGTPSGATTGMVDLITGDVFTSSTTVTTGNITNTKAAWAYDGTTDKWFGYYLGGTNFVATDAHIRYDFETDTWTRMASVPWSTSQNVGQSWLMWDGSDTIYIIIGNNSALFYKYSISGNSYTVRTSAPVSLGNTTSLNGAIYVPSTVTGFTSDVIYVMGVNGGTTLHSYNINSNTWNDTGNGTGNLTIPQTLDASCGIVWDHQKYAYFYKRNALTTLYRMDLTATGSGWSVSGASFDASTNTQTTSAVLNHPACFLRCTSASSCTYFIQGNADSLTVVTKLPIGSGRYYWGYYGKIQTRRRSEIATTTGSASAGTNVSIAVDSSTGYLAGDTVTIIDPSNGTQETAIVYAIPDITHIQFTIVNSYTTGSFIGYDPFQTVITGDSGWALAPVTPKGYKFDLEPSYYLLTPTMRSSLFNVSSSDGMGYVQPSEPMLGLENYNSAAANSPFTRIGMYGTLLNTYLAPQIAYPGPQAEDTLNISGLTYKWFPQQTQQRFANVKYGIVMKSS